LQRALAREELSFRGMLRDQRMRAAYEALATTSEPIDHIANACGYGELSSFYRAFKQKFERTPYELRSETFLLNRFEPPGSTVSSVG
jgi:AraC-like DNA-binding protein